MRIGLLPAVATVWVACIVWLPAWVGAQSGTEVSPVVLVHPDVSTILQLPDEIQTVRSADNRDILVKGVGNELYLRPRPDTPAGVEVFIDVQTRTLHRILLLRVVERAEDAMQRLAIPAAPAAECAVETPDPSAVATGPAMPAPETAAATESAGRDTSRFAVSVHAVAALAGTTELDVAGYEAKQARQPHRALGVRLAVHPRGGWLAVVANVGGEWPVAPTVHGRGPNAEPEAPELVTVSGPRLHADVGMKSHLGTRWSPTVYAGIGLHVHHRNTEAPTELEGSKGDMPFGGVLALGLGLEYRARNLLLGLEFHVRQGIPADYRSVAALLSVGWILDQGE